MAVVDGQGRGVTVNIPSVVGIVSEDGDEMITK